MSNNFRVITTLSFALALAGVATAHAQNPSSVGITVSAMMINYDLSGVGTTPGIAVRSTYPLAGHVSLEFGGVFATPDQQFGASSLFIPEAQLRYRWSAGRVAPYIGGGLGVARVASDFHIDWDPTLSIAAGAGIRLTERLELNGEFRLRGHEWRFVGDTAELSAGLTWQLPSFSRNAEAKGGSTS
jgi:hypothetical protein